MTIVQLLLEILFGFLLADLLSGLIHWLEDRYGAETWPVLGPLVIAPNRLHHEEPMAFTRSSFLSRNSTCAAVAVLVAVPLALAFGPSAWLAAAFMGGALANEFHFWAHCPDRAPTLVHCMRMVGLAQSRRHHAIHHAAPNDRCYCVLSSWLNPALDRIGLWQKLEKLLPDRWRA